MKTLLIVLAVPVAAFAGDPLDQPPQGLLPEYEVEEGEAPPAKPAEPKRGTKDKAPESAPQESDQGAPAPHPGAIISKGSDIPSEAQLGPFHFKLSGFAKLEVNGIFTAAGEPPFVGRTAGFRIENARLYLDGDAAQMFRVRLSVEGASERPRGLNTTAGDRIVALKDAYAEWLPMPWLVVRAGQYKAPFNGEDLLSTADLKFARRSAVTRGVRADEGYNEPGISYDRQVGAGASAGFTFLDGKAQAGAELQLFNGNGPNLLANDNRALAVAARATGGAFGVTLGASFVFNPRTAGELPDLLDENELGVAGDLTAEMFGARLFAMGVLRQTTFASLPGQPVANALGVVVEASYQLANVLPWLHLEPAYRFELYDPSSLFPTHALQHHTIGLNWYAHPLPVKVQVNYTLKLEHAQRVLANDEVQGLVQVSF